MGRAQTGLVSDSKAAVKIRKQEERKAGSGLQGEGGGGGGGAEGLTRHPAKLALAADVPP